MPQLPPSLRYVTPAELAERLDVQRRGAPFLVYVDAARRQHLVPLGPDRDALSIGREPASDVSLEWDDEVSRAHAILERVGGTWTLVDEGLSRNGSYINDERVQRRRRLADGDVITIGKTVLAYLAPRARQRTTVTTQSGAPPEVSPAQRRVLAALCRPALDGPFATPATNREIAGELVVSVETVKTHMHTLFELFEVPDMPQNRKRAELVRRALERGVVLD